MEALVTQTKREVINFGESWKTSEREEEAGDFKVRYLQRDWSITKNTSF